MSRYVWNHSKVRGPDGKTSTVLPGVLDLMVLGAEYFREKRIADMTCPKCMGICVENICQECGTIRPGPHSKYPRQKPDTSGRDLLVIVVVLFVIIMLLAIVTWLIGYHFMNAPRANRY